MQWSHFNQPSPGQGEPLHVALQCIFTRKTRECSLVREHDHGPWEQTTDSKMARWRPAAGMVVLRVVVATFGRFVMLYFSFLRKKGYLLPINWVLWLILFLFDRKVHGTSIDGQLQEPRARHPGKRFCFLSRSLVKVSFCHFVSEIDMKRFFFLDSDTERTCRSVRFECGQTCLFIDRKVGHQLRAYFWLISNLSLLCFVSLSSIVYQVYRPVFVGSRLFAFLLLQNFVQCCIIFPFFSRFLSPWESRFLSPWEFRFLSPWESRFPPPLLPSPVHLPPPFLPVSQPPVPPPPTIHVLVSLWCSMAVNWHKLW